MRVAWRWGLVALGAVVAVATPSVLTALPLHVPALSPAAVRQRIVGSANEPYEGFASTQAEFGLPSLPDLGDVTSLLSGTTAVRVWYRSAQLNRVDVIDTVGEHDVYTTPAGQYTWDYTSDLLTEVTGTQSIRLPMAGDLVPPALAQRVLAMDPSDPVTALPPQRVAGIDAVGVRLRPTDPATTVGEVDIWADPATGLPLRVTITARGATTPILISQFSSVSYTNPAQATLTPPVSGAGGVSTVAAPNVLSDLNSLGRFPLPATLAGYARQPGIPGLPGVGRYGSGLATFVVLPLPADIGASAIHTATTAGASQLNLTRGRAVLIQIPILTVLLEQVGFGHRVFLTYLVAGFVSPSVLQQAAVELAPTRHRPFR